MDIISGSIAIRRNGPMIIGQACHNHEHNFDHTTICFYGAMSIECAQPDGTRGTEVIRSARPGYDGASHFLVPAHVKHIITALEPDTIFWCVYSHRDESGKIVQHFDGNDEAYSTWIGDNDPRKP